MGAFEMRKRVSSSANSQRSRDEVAKKLRQLLANPKPDLIAPQANQIGILRRLKLQYIYRKKKHSAVKTFVVFISRSILLFPCRVR
jgi:hypothetical protein